MPFPSPGDLSHPGIEPGSPALQAYSLLSYDGIPLILGVINEQTKPNKTKQVDTENKLVVTTGEGQGKDKMGRGSVI